MGKVNEFGNQKYVNLQTYRKNGQPVNTPVWFVLSDEKMYVVTRELTGKVKRIKNNTDVKIVLCTFSGKLKGEWISGKAEKITGEEADKAISLRNKKYGFWAKMIGIFSAKKGQYVVYSILLE
jgi:PPOX class probable F420-dependent enzyme